MCNSVNSRSFSVSAHCQTSLVSVVVYVCRKSTLMRYTYTDLVVLPSLRTAQWASSESATEVALIEFK